MTCCKEIKNAHIFEGFSLMTGCKETKRSCRRKMSILQDKAFSIKDVIMFITLNFEYCAINGSPAPSKND